jgi:WD40 repeat protein
LKEFPEHGDCIHAVLMPDESTVITGTGANTHTIRVWDVASGSCSHKFDHHTRSIIRLKTIGNQLISGSYDQTVRIWDLVTGNELHRLEGHARYPSVFGFNDDETLMAVSCGTGDIKIWRIKDGLVMLVYRDGISC